MEQEHTRSQHLHGYGYTPGAENTSRTTYLSTNTSRLPGKSEVQLPGLFDQANCGGVSCDGPVLNTKAEWHQPAIWRVRSELSQE